VSITGLECFTRLCYVFLVSEGIWEKAVLGMDGKRRVKKIISRSGNEK
jgi:hypothetical protein